MFYADSGSAWSGKTADAALDPYWMETDAFGLQQVNFLPTPPGLYAGFLPWPWLIVLLALTGLAAGQVGWWLLRRRTPARLVVLAGAVQPALGYEGDFPSC